MPNGIRRFTNRAGFTLIELLVVIGIIVILVGILLPVVSTMRKRAQQADTTAEVTRLAESINHYFQDYSAYPGPIPETQIYGNNASTSQSNVLTGASIVSSTENMVLGLLGGISAPTTATQTTFTYAATNLTPPVGPQSLNYLNPKQAITYYDASTAELSNNGVGTLTSWVTTQAAATPGVTPPALTIPEIMDHYSNPHPIIYLRAVRGAGGVGIAVCDAARSTSSPGSQYFTAELNPYWRVYTSVTQLSGAALPTATKFSTVDYSGSMLYPTNVSFFQNSTLNDGITPRSRDSFILISAGYDGCYGTSDDVMYSN